MIGGKYSISSYKRYKHIVPVRNKDLKEIRFKENSFPFALIVNWTSQIICISRATKETGTGFIYVLTLHK